jgi:GMP synthase (glutamine-hydrolysing)
MGKTAVALRHLAFEDLGCFEAVLAGSGYAVRYSEVGVDDLGAPLVYEADLLVVLGGPIGAYDDALYPFLRRELSLLEVRLAAARPTIGICLGAQLMARALGARVYPGEREIGFAPIELTAAGRGSCLSAFEAQPVLHWHGDTFDLPPDADLLASTDKCRNQAFAVGRRAVAFQFHPEAGEAGFERWLIGHTLELRQAGVDIGQLRAEYARHASALRACSARCLGAWLGQLDGLRP